MSIHPTTLVSRRTVLIGAAAAAGAAALTACGTSGDADGPTAGSTASAAGSAKGSAKEPLAKPAQFQESPLLKAQVDAGTLPKLEDRLPESPYVVPHNWVQQGKYGGHLKMNITGTSGDDAPWVGEWFYGYSHAALPQRRPGRSARASSTKWQSNADASEWTFTLRKGLKWSDGQAGDHRRHPVLVERHGQRRRLHAGVGAGRGQVGQGHDLQARRRTDDHTFMMTFDAPAPLTADRLAMWTNGSGGNGPTWIVPAHYAKQFHPKYNKCARRLGRGRRAVAAERARTSSQPEVPDPDARSSSTKYNEGRSLTWERNPYAYEVTKDGDQLPYIDGITMTAVVQTRRSARSRSPPARSTSATDRINSLILADVSTLMKNKDKAGIDVYLWDSGSGAAAMLLPLPGLLRQAVPRAVPRAEVPPGAVARVRPAPRPRRPSTSRQASSPPAP